MAEKRVSNKKRRANILLAILSIILAMILWLVLSVTALSEIQVTLRDVPIDFSLENSFADLYGLSVINRDLESVSVSFTGQRDRIGNYTADDLRVSLDLNTVRASGSYDLPLVVTSVNGDQIENIEIAPKRTVHVEFDLYASKTFTVDSTTLRLDLGNIKAARGYVIDEEEIIISPERVTISGLQDYIDQVTECVIYFEEAVQLNESADLSTRNVRLMSGNSVFENDQVTFDVDSFDVYIPVYVTKNIPLDVSIQSYSDEIDVNTIPYTFSQDSILVRSQNSTKIEDIENITLGIIPLRNIRPGYVTTFNIARSSYYENISGVDNIDVIFDLEGYAERSITITNSQMHIVNPSSAYNVIIESDRINVTLVGPQEVIEQIDPSNVVAQINLLDFDLSTGPRFFDATVYVPGYSNVWSCGDAKVYAQVEPVEQVDVDADE